MVKGHLEISDQTALESAAGYFKRLWFDGCNGAPLSTYEEGFEEAYAAYQQKRKMDSL